MFRIRKILDAAKQNNRRITVIFSAVIFLAGGILSLTGCSRAEAYEVTGFYFDTVISVDFYESDQMNIKSTEVEDGIKELCGYYEDLLSATIETSEVSKINKAGGKPVEVSDDTAFLLEKALEVSKLTNGAYDPSIAPLSGLWNISEVCKTAGDLSEEERQGLIPSDDEIANALALVDYSKVSLKGNTVTLYDEDLRIDLGGIAKGYIADKLVEYLTDAGVEHALINLGGNVAAIGGKKDGEPYWIGLQKPFGNGGEAFLKLKDKDKAVVTSGPYERYFEANNRIYHHILDVGTGKPVENDLYAVTIVGEEGVMSDALSTACYCLGYEESLRLLDKLDGYEGIFIFDDYSYRTTEGFPAEYGLSIIDPKGSRTNHVDKNRPESTK